MFNAVLENIEYDVCIQKVESEVLIDHLSRYAEDKDVHIVSLSGGVDSMVILDVRE